MEQSTLLFTLQIANSIIQILSLIFLIIYVIKTWEMASATRRSALATEKSVVEMKESRDQETAPYVIAYFDVPVGSRLIFLVVKNIGHSVANKVRISFTPNLITSRNISFADMNFIKEGIESMPPEYEIRTFMDMTPSYLGNSAFPLKYNVKIAYFGGIENVERVTEQTLDLSAQKGLMSIIKKDFDDLVSEVNHVYREIEKISRAIDNINDSINDGVFINNPALTISSLGEDLSNWKKSLSSKLREFENLWLIAYKEDRLEGYYLDELQKHILHISGQFLLLLSNKPSGINIDLVESLSKLSEQLHKLGHLTFYMDGGASVNEFNSQGDKIIEQIKQIFVLIEKDDQFPNSNNHMQQ